MVKSRGKEDFRLPNAGHQCKRLSENLEKAIKAWLNHARHIDVWCSRCFRIPALMLIALYKDRHFVLNDQIIPCRRNRTSPWLCFPISGKECKTLFRKSSYRAFRMLLSMLHLIGFFLFFPSIQCPLYAPGVNF